MSQPLRQKQHVGFGRTVERDTELGRKSHHRTNVDDAPRAGLRKARCDCCGEPRQCGYVQRDLGFDGLGRLLQKMPRLRHACIVNEDTDTCVMPQASFQCRQLCRIGQVSMQHLNGNLVLLTQAHGQRIQPRLVARNKNKIVATASKTFGIGGTDTAGGAGDKDSRKCGHVISLI
ncbi:hypothetical protein D3C71_1001370 [compost metagenome]